MFAGVYVPLTLGQFLRESTHGHTLQLASVLRAHLVNLIAGHSICCPASAEQVFVDVDSLLRPVYGHAKQGASYGHTKIAGKQVLRQGLSPLATTLSTPTRAPVLAGLRLRAGKAGSGKGPSPMVAEAVRCCPNRPAPPCGPGPWRLRGRSTASSPPAGRAGAQFSLVLVKNQAVTTGDRGYPRPRVDSGQYPGAVRDPDTGEGDL